jgi:hypothetical protein
MGIDEREGTVGVDLVPDLVECELGSPLRGGSLELSFAVCGLLSAESLSLSLLSQLGALLSAQACVIAGGGSSGSGFAAIFGPGSSGMSANRSVSRISRRSACLTHRDRRCPCISLLARLCFVRSSIDIVLPPEHDTAYQ